MGEVNMSVLAKLASAQGRKDEAPNKALAVELVEKNDLAGIQEIAANLHNKDRKIQYDCLAVLEQVGDLKPELIEDYVADFLQLIYSKNNRLVWAAMIDLAKIADRKPEPIIEQYNDIVQVIEKGSVITKDNGIKVMARVASVKDAYNQKIMPYLLGQLRTCRAKSLPQYAESVRVAVNPDNQAAYLSILNERVDALSVAQQRRIKKLLKSF
jgi:hypothetical protein